MGKGERERGERGGKEIDRWEKREQVKFLLNDLNGIEPKKTHKIN